MTVLLEKTDVRIALLTSSRYGAAALAVELLRLGWNKPLARKNVTHFVVVGSAGAAQHSFESVPPESAALDVLAASLAAGATWPEAWSAVDALRRVACYRLRSQNERASADLLDGLVRLTAWM
ncbi:MAG: hypothetical protein GIW95_09670 [Candidatus Eremiobacteraeota bacterium]|nr:hypothetical protein [Candidatus Eremiobacteraeota bacterium]